MNKIGIIQGRLLPPIDNHIQEFPRDNWEKEFSLLNKLNLSHIEWIITEKSLPFNPLFKQSLASYPISVICCDHLIHESIDNYEFLKTQLVSVCEAAIKSNIKTIGIPLLEASSLESDTKRKNFIANINKISEQFPSLFFSFEAELGWQKVMEIVNSNEKYKLTYDTGNITSHCGITVHEEYLTNVFDKVDNVHLKDRKRYHDGWKTVFPSTGDTNFDLIFRVLKNLGYDKNYTLQTARSVFGIEEQTISYHKLILENLYDRS